MAVRILLEVKVEVRFKTYWHSQLICKKQQHLLLRLNLLSLTSHCYMDGKSDGQASLAVVL